MKTLKIYNRLSLSFLVLIGLTACGFHLRGDYSNLQHKNVYINTAFYAPAFSNTLYSRTKTLHINPVSDPKKAHVRVYLLDLKTDRQIHQISTNTQVKQYRLQETLQYQLKRAHAKKRSTIKTITVQRLLLENANQRLSANNVADTLHKEMHRELINRLFEQMARQV